MSNLRTIIGDPHVTIDSRDKATVLFQKIEDLGNPTIWLGDLLHTKAVIRGECQNLFFDYFKSSKLHHIVLVGNHDYFNLQCEDHSLKTLSSLPNVTIVDEPLIDGNLVFFPYIHDKSYLRDLLLNPEMKDKIGFGHFEIGSFDFGNGQICEDGISTDDFSLFKHVYSGHFHKYQSNGNITFLGTPFSHSFGEANQEKFIGIFDEQLNKLSLIKPGLPEHLSFDINCEDPNCQENIKNIIKNNGNNLLRIRLFGTPEKVSLINQSQLGAKFQDKSEEENVSNLSLDDTIDNKSQFLTWANEIKGLDQSTIKLGLSILEGLGAK